MKVILASNSPRRRELLKNAGVLFQVLPSDYVEPKYNGKSPEKYAEFLALNKAKSVFEKTGGIVIGADTIVAINGKILGKPSCEEDAFSMLKELSNNVHEVITGYAVVTESKTVNSHEKTLVTFNELSDELILDYIKTGSPMDKAGAYGIQDGFELVKSTVGSYDNVVGLPTQKILQILAELK